MYQRLGIDMKELRSLPNSKLGTAQEGDHLVILGEVPRAIEMRVGGQGRPSPSSPSSLTTSPWTPTSGSPGSSRTSGTKNTVPTPCPSRESLSDSIGRPEAGPRENPVHRRGHHRASGVLESRPTGHLQYSLPLPGGNLLPAGGGGRTHSWSCLLYTSPSPRDRQKSRMPSSA